METEMETGTGITKMIRFDLEIVDKDEGTRCYLCHTSLGQMFVVRPPDSPRGKYACIAHVGDVADQWDQAEVR